MILVAIAENLRKTPHILTTISQSKYDALGQVKTKRIGNVLDSLKFEYNIRGWMIGMNRDFLPVLVPQIISKPDLQLLDAAARRPRPRPAIIW